MVAYIRVLRFRLPGLHNLQLGVVHRMVEVVLIQVEVVLLLVEVVVVEVHNLIEVVFTIMLFQVGQRLRLQMLLYIYYLCLSSINYCIIWSRLYLFLCVHVFCS